ncbi:MAG: ABC transporter ATP-binding protein, partial [Oscillospiraceae bacterium]|nr:ABC transporter ATP-binding protein [Oscillospiraceae bacterium]
MLKLTRIVKNYSAGDAVIPALRDVDIEFRRSEFVAVFGPSGCGKTTLLNIIGGLDRYTSGDMAIDGVSTKEYKDGDWDIYRNKAIGFVFQSYNLIPHQSVLSNVELALTLSGVSPAERKKRAAEALTKVGLSDQMRKKPNQLSGGQMQRVAIARALVNDPEILLADEPTGALDTETSVQVMDILKEISKDRLVIMVTHNPDLAEKYANRIVRLLDGRVISDTNPYNGHTARPITRQDGAQGKLKEKRNRKKPMTMLTALSLSLNNLMTKKARTLLTGFAGSIGIIGIALILSMSNGMQAYIAGIERDAMSSYPIVINSASMELGALLTTMASLRENAGKHDMDKVYSKDVMGSMLSSMSSQISANDLASFKTFLDGNEEAALQAYDIQYQYDTPLIVYKADTSSGPVKLEPSQMMEQMTPSRASGMASLNSAAVSESSAWKRLIDDDGVLESQFTVLAGRMPCEWDEVAVLVDEHNEISDYQLFSLGLRDPSEITSLMMDAASGKAVNVEQSVYTYDELMGLRFKLVAPTDVFERNGEVWTDRGSDDEYMKSVVDAAAELKVVGVLRASSDTGMVSSNGAIGYTPALMDYLMDAVRESEVAKAQLENQDVDVFSGKVFRTAASASAVVPDLSLLTDEQKAQLAALTPEQRDAMMARLTQSAAAQTSSATYDGNL